MATIFKSVRHGSDNVDYSAADAALLAAHTVSIAANTAAITTNTAAARGFRGLGNAGVAVTAADYPAVLDDAGKRIDMNRGTAQTATIPLNATIAFVVDQDVLTWRQVGVGAFTLTPATGAVTITPPPGKTLVSNGAGSVVSAVKTGTNTWQAYGDLVPS